MSYMVNLLAIFTLANMFVPLTIISSAESRNTGSDSDWCDSCGRAHTCAVCGDTEEKREARSPSLPPASAW